MLGQPARRARHQVDAGPRIKGRKEPAVREKTVTDEHLPLPPGAVADPRRSRRIQVYELVREAIASLWLKPGEAINEMAIANQLNISRTPVREALLRLSDEGLVDIRSHAGTFVSHIRLQAVFEGQMLRESLELTVLRRVANRLNRDIRQRLEGNLAQQWKCVSWRDHQGFHILDEEFHRTLSDCAGTPRIWAIIDSAKVQLDRVRMLGDRIPGQLEQRVQEHQAIFDQLIAGDVDAACDTLKSHLDGVFSTIKIVINEHPELFIIDAEANDFSTDGPPPARSALPATNS
jgi:DNA-binding GntR family transcriptional regulator